MYRTRSVRATVTGPTGTIFPLLGRARSEMDGGTPGGWSSRASSFARSVLTAARTRTVCVLPSKRIRVRAAVKTELCLTAARTRSLCVRPSKLESEQTRELQVFPQLEQRQQRLHIRAPGGSTRTLTRRLPPRASPLDERCSVVDTVRPKATRTPPCVPLRARAEKSPHSPVSLEETACCS